MSPKFSGGADAWLDDEGGHGSQPGHRKKKSPHEKAIEFPLEQSNATVIEVYPNQCRVILDGGVSTLLCPYRRHGVRKQTNTRERTFVVVGDRVVIAETGKEVGKESGIVEGVCPRTNMLSRPAPGRDEGGLRHVIGANLDRVVIVVSARQPDFSCGLVDRFLVAIQAAGIEPVLCITKIDLFDSPDASPWSVYSKIGYAVIEVSSKTGVGVEVLRDRIAGQRVLFCGQSGVGKTSLLRVLLGAQIGKVSEVSQVTGKGKHTTTSTVMLSGPQGAQWLDSPGMSEFGLVDVQPEELARYYPEFTGLDCDQPGCHHVGEAACKAPAHERHTGYVRIFESLKAGRH